MFFTLFSLNSKREKVLASVLKGDGLALLVKQCRKCAMLNLNPLYTGA